MSVWFCWRRPPDTSLPHCPLVVQIIQNVLFDPIVIYMVHKPIEECTIDTALSLFFTFNHPASKDVLCSKMCFAVSTRMGLGLKGPFWLIKLSKNNFLFTIAFASHIYIMLQQKKSIFIRNTSCFSGMWFLMSTQTLQIWYHVKQKSKRDLAQR